jgi:hypothetical protein
MSCTAPSQEIALAATILFLAVASTAHGFDSAYIGDANETAASVGDTDTEKEPRVTVAAELRESATTAQKKALRRLGRELFLAIRDDDLATYQAFWLNINDVERLLKPRPHRLELMREYVKLRDQIVTLSFPILRRGLSNVFTDLKAVQEVNVSSGSNPQDDGRISFLDFTLTEADSKKVDFRIQEGLFTDGRWYFVELPTSLLNVKDGEQLRPVFLRRLATDDELKKLKDLLQNLDALEQKRDEGR